MYWKWESMLHCTLPECRIPGGWRHCKNDSVLHGLRLLQYDATMCLINEQCVEQIFVEYMLLVHNIPHCTFLHVFLMKWELEMFVHHTGIFWLHNGFHTQRTEDNTADYTVPVHLTSVHKSFKLRIVCTILIHCFQY